MKQHKSAKIVIFVLGLFLSLSLSAGAAGLPQFIDAGPAPASPLSSPAQGAEPFVASPPDEFVPGEVLVKFKDDLSPDNANAAGLMKEFGGELKRTHKHLKMHLFSLKNAKSKEKTLDAIEKMKKNSLVEFAEPNGIIRTLPTAGTEAIASAATSTLNDPLLGSQYALNAIYASTAWSLTSGDPAGYVAVVDTGVNWSHPDLAGKVDVPSDQSGNCISPGTLPMDDNGHGTHVAGIAAATGNNGLGIAGVAYDQRILAVKVLDASGSGTWDSVACGIDIAAAVPEVKVISLSVGGSGGSTTLYNAVYNAWVTYGKTVVIANGNEGATLPSPYSYPACYSLNGVAIAVGATTIGNFRAMYSSANKCITVSAPGDRIMSTYSTNYSTDNAYSPLSGTSMATPAVSGTVGLMQHYMPRSNNDVLNHLTSTATDRGPAGWEILYGYGIINAYRGVLSY
jgi:thermitase